LVRKPSAFEWILQLASQRSSACDASARWRRLIRLGLLARLDRRLALRDRARRLRHAPRQPCRLRLLNLYGFTEHGRLRHLQLRRPTRPPRGPRDAYGAAEHGNDDDPLPLILSPKPACP